MNEPDSRWRLDGRTALVTGASHGIGLACARELAGRGADVLLVARQTDALAVAREQLAAAYPARRFDSLTADVADSAQRTRLADAIGERGLSPSLLVNNVGGNRIAAVSDYGEAEVRELLELNLMSAFAICRLAQPWLVAHPHAAIVNIGSVAARTHVGTGAPYAMAKAGLEQLTRNLACEWAADGIRVNAVSPWYIRTRRSERKLEDTAYRERVLARTPLGRIGEPEEVAATVAFLCLPAAGFITGESVAVDGGFLKHGFAG